MNVAVTGANGHVGNNLCRQLLSLGYNVKGLIHRSANGLKDLDIDTVDGNILDPSSLDKLVRDSEVVFHLAAKIDLYGDKRNMYTTQVEGTRNIAEACIRNNVRRLVHFSTIHAIEHTPDNSPLNENRPLISGSRIMYEISKAKAESFIQDIPAGQLETIVLNPTAIMGPFDFAPSMSGQLILQLQARTIPALIPGGYNWVDVRDVAAAACQAIDHGQPGNRYILSGAWHSLREIALMVEEFSGKKIPKFEMPMLLAWIGLPFIQAISFLRKERPLYTRDSLIVVAGSSRNIDNSKAREKLAFKSRPLKETVRDTIHWFKEMGHLSD